MKPLSILSRLLRLVAFLFVVHAVEFLLIGGIWYVLDIQSRSSLTAKLGIEPSWISFEKYIETHFEVGMSRTEVIKQAEIVGPFSVEPFFSGLKYCEEYSFRVGPLGSPRGGRWWICYENDVVISVWRYRYQ